MTCVHLDRVVLGSKFDYHIFFLSHPPPSRAMYCLIGQFKKKAMLYLIVKHLRKILHISIWVIRVQVPSQVRRCAAASIVI